MLDSFENIDAALSRILRCSLQPVSRDAQGERMPLFRGRDATITIVGCSIPFSRVASLADDPSASVISTRLAKAGS
jgi:hypothetical protein